MGRCLQAPSPSPVLVAVTIGIRATMGMTAAGTETVAMGGLTDIHPRHRRAELASRPLLPVPTPEE